MIGCFPLFSRSFPSSKTLQQKGDISCHQPKFTASKTHLFSITGCICSHRFIMSSLQYLQLSTNRWFFAALKTDHILTPKKKTLKNQFGETSESEFTNRCPTHFFQTTNTKKVVLYMSFGVPMEKAPLFRLPKVTKGCSAP